MAISAHDGQSQNRKTDRQEFSVCGRRERSRFVRLCGGSEQTPRKTCLVGLRRASRTGENMEALRIDGKLIGPEHPPYFIAEIGSNHNGDMDLARKLIDAVVETGADAVKFQSWSKKSLVSKAEFARNTKYADSFRHFGSLEEMVEKYQLTPQQHREVAAYCDKKGVTFISTPFSKPEVDLLDELGIPFFKIASMDVNNLPLLAEVGAKVKPVMLSTGMATLGEIERALAVLREA